jgi:hypothetical protein
LTATYTGFVASQNTNALTSLASLNTSANPSSPAGVFPITASGATAANYSFNYVDGALTVVADAGLENVHVSGSDFTFTIQTLAGQMYQVEYTEDLGSAWIPLGAAFAGTGSPVEIITTISSPRAFFRVSISLE